MRALASSGRRLRCQRLACTPNDDPGPDEVSSPDDLDQVEGQVDKLAGRLRERYGWSQEQAETEVERFMHDIEIPV